MVTVKLYNEIGDGFQKDLIVAVASGYCFRAFGVRSVFFGGDTVAVVSDYLVYLVVMLIEKRMMVVSGVILILLSLQL